jgi:hypothetical protein
MADELFYTCTCGQADRTTHKADSRCGNFANAPNKTYENEERRPNVRAIAVTNSERDSIALVCSNGCVSGTSSFRLSHFRYKPHITVTYNWKLIDMQEVYHFVAVL